MTTEGRWGRIAATGAVALLAALAAACEARDDGGAGDAPAAAAAAYDADSAARGLLEPGLASLLAIEPLLEGPFVRDGGRRAPRRCKVDTLAQLRHPTVRFDVMAGDTMTTLFARHTPAGELRRAEVLRRLPDGVGVGAAWDADTRTVTITEFVPGGARQTRNRDPEAPVARALRYVGRRLGGTECGGRGMGPGNGE